MLEHAHLYSGTILHKSMVTLLIFMIGINLSRLQLSALIRPNVKWSSLQHPKKWKLRQRVKH